MRPARSDEKRFRFEGVAWWRLPLESRVVAWSLLGIAVLGFAAVIVMGTAVSAGRQRCSRLCAEREYAFKDYTPAGRFGTGPAVCTCVKDGVPIQVPMR